MSNPNIHVRGRICFLKMYYIIIFTKPVRDEVFLLGTAENISAGVWGEDPDRMMSATYGTGLQPTEVMTREGCFSGGKNRSCAIKNEMRMKEELFVLFEVH